MPCSEIEDSQSNAPESVSPLITIFQVYSGAAALAFTLIAEM